MQRGPESEYMDFEARRDIENAVIAKQREEQQRMKRLLLMQQTAEKEGGLTPANVIAADAYGGSRPASGEARYRPPPDNLRAVGRQDSWESFPGSGLMSPPVGQRSRAFVNHHGDEYFGDQHIAADRATQEYLNGRHLMGAVDGRPVMSFSRQFSDGSNMVPAIFDRRCSDGGSQFYGQLPDRVGSAPPGPPPGSRGASNSTQSRRSFEDSADNLRHWKPENNRDLDASVEVLRDVAGGQPSSSDGDGEDEPRKRGRRTDRSRKKRQKRKGSEPLGSESPESSSERGSKRLNRKWLKPEKYDGNTSFETFMCGFENCAKYNKWNECDKVANLKWSLAGSAAQLLWEAEESTYSELVDQLRRRF